MRIALTVVCIALLSSLCSAATIFVPDNYLTIQGAIGASVAGDVIIVRPGTYVENIDFQGKGITLRSEKGAIVTTIDGGQAGSVVTFKSGEVGTTVLAGFTITNGSGTLPNYDGAGIYCFQSSPTIFKNNIIENKSTQYGFGGGIFCLDKSSPNITENTISSNEVVFGGGGICCQGQSSPSIEENTIIRNIASQWGGGIFCRSLSSPVVTNNEIKGNTAVLFHGGGIYCDDSSSPEISINDITENTAKAGGGISCWSNSSPTISGNHLVSNDAITGGGIFCDDSSPTIVDNTITGNVNVHEGGGITLDNGSDTFISNNTITANSAVKSWGGGIYSEDSSPTIINNTISGNMSDRKGGGISLRRGSSSSIPLISNNTIENNHAEDGGGIHADSCELIIEGNIINGNFADVSNGGGIFCEDINPYGIRISNNIITENTARDGGGFCCNTTRSAIALTNNIIARNKADRGGGVYCEWSSTIITNNTITGNTADDGGGFYCNHALSFPYIRNTILYENTAVGSSEMYIESGEVTISNSVVNLGSSSVHVEPGAILNVKIGVIQVDPFFVDSARGDYHLTANSPCVNSGDNTAVNDTSDFEKDIRIAQSTVDIGADEFYYHLYYVGEVLAGAPVEMKIVGRPGITSLLALGNGIQNPPQSTQHGDLWLKMPLAKSWQLGTIPGTGILSFTATVPLGWSSGSQHPFQALVGPWGSSGSELTNLIVLEVD
jgi:parallel beta-helix repeat protein